MVYHVRACNRYYGLIRQPDELRPVWLSQLILAGLCPDGAARLAFPSLLCHTFHTCRYPERWAINFDVGVRLSDFEGNVVRPFNLEYGEFIFHG
jgi:hypothetical protein